jgi:hypothetical protein
MIKGQVLLRQLRVSASFPVEENPNNAIEPLPSGKDTSGGGRAFASKIGLVQKWEMGACFQLREIHVDGTMESREWYFLSS